MTNVLNGIFEESAVVVCYWTCCNNDLVFNIGVPTHPNIRQTEYKIPNKSLRFYSFSEYTNTLYTCTLYSVCKLSLIIVTLRENNF